MKKPIIFGILGFVGIGVTAAVSFFQGMKAQKILDKLPEDATKSQKIKAISKPIIISGVSALTTGAMFALSEKNHIDKEKSLLATANILQAGNSLYRKKIKEIAGDGPIEEIEESINHYIFDNAIPEYSERGKDIVDVYCSFSGRYFRMSMDNIMNGIETFNYMLRRDRYATLNTYFTSFKLSNVDYAEGYIWNLDKVNSYYAVDDIGLYLKPVQGRDNAFELCMTIEPDIALEM